MHCENAGSKMQLPISVVPCSEIQSLQSFLLFGLNAPSMVIISNIFWHSPLVEDGDIRLQGL